jgi:hypothetical protein
MSSPLSLHSSTLSSTKFLVCEHVLSSSTCMRSCFCFSVLACFCFSVLPALDDLYSHNQSYALVCDSIQRLCRFCSGAPLFRLNLSYPTCIFYHHNGTGARPVSSPPPPPSPHPLYLPLWSRQAGLWTTHNERVRPVPTSMTFSSVFGETAIIN